MHGYALSLDPTNGYFNLIKLDPAERTAEHPLPFKNLANDDLRSRLGLQVHVGDTFTMSFEVSGTTLIGRLYSSTGELLSTISKTDISYTDGKVGTWGWRKTAECIEGTWSDLCITEMFS